MILVTDGVLATEIYEKAKFTYDDLKKKKKLSKIVRNLDIKKLKNIEKVCSGLISSMIGMDIKIKIIKY